MEWSCYPNCSQPVLMNIFLNSYVVFNGGMMFYCKELYFINKQNAHSFTIVSNSKKTTLQIKLFHTILIISMSQIPRSEIVGP